MSVPATGLPALKQQRPEWSPWLAVVEEVVRETGASAWDAAVPSIERQDSAAPLLAGASLTVSARAVRGLVERLLRAACRGGSANMAGLTAVLDRNSDTLALFTASLCQQDEGVRAVARSSGVDADALQAVAALAPVPFLQACGRRWEPAIGSWQQGYCPLCGSWPAFAEVRGIERSRCLRCPRCGTAWQAHALHCAFCAASDHRELAVLVPEQARAQAVIEACRRCLGYMKSFTRLQGCAPHAVMIEDLATVDLDVAALGEGFARPQRPGYSFDVAIARIP